MGNGQTKGPSQEVDLLLSLEVVQEHGTLLGLLTPVLDDDAGAVNDLAGVTLAVKLAKTNPLAEHLAIRNLDQRNLMLRAKRNNKLLVRLLLAALVQHAHVSLAAVEGLGCLAETTGKTVVDERDAENALQCVQDGHLATRAGFGGNFDFIGDGDGGVGSGLFSVRHFDSLFVVLGLDIKCRMILKEFRRWCLSEIVTG